MKIVLEDRIRVIDLPNEKTWTEDEFFHFCMANQDLNLERDKDGNVLILSPYFFKAAFLRPVYLPQFRTGMTKQD